MDLELSKKTLVIVESPTKATTIRQYLPKNFTVVASKGHVRDLPSDRMGIDCEKNFTPEYVIVDKKGPLITDLKKKLSTSEQLLLATDEDREGESISWHLVQVLKPTVPYKRMVFHEITKKAINASLNQGRDLDTKLVDAQEDRRLIDRLYGYEVSPVLWKRLSNKKLSAGRVQSVGLRLVVEKEMVRMNYKSSTYYDIEATLSTEKREKLVAKLESVDGKRIANGKDFNAETGAFNNKAVLLDENKTQELIKEAKTLPFVVESVMQRPTTAHPYPPFTTSTLQQAGNARLHMSAKETMRIAQSLFEHGFITYMRTDSTHLSAECIDASREAILKNYGDEFLNPTVRVFSTKSKNAQEAHEAIRPSGDVIRRPDATGLTGRELALYTLIYQRTLATQMTPAQKSTTTIKLSNGKNGYTASGTVIVFPGFLKVYGMDATEEEEEDKVIPSVGAGDKLKTDNLDMKEHITNPPNRFTEASLVKKLEEQGVGRPSTYATIISTLLDRGYVLEEKNTLIPTFLGFATLNFLNVAFAPLIDYNYTSEMENKLDEIANGEMDRLKYLEEFYYGKNGLSQLVKTAKAGKEDVKTLSLPNLSLKCELEDKVINYSIKVGPYGAYIATDAIAENGKPVLVNIPSFILPGSICEEDVKSLISSAITPVAQEEVPPGTIVLKEGRWGKYWEKDGKTVNVPKGKVPVESYTSEQIDFLFSLPKEIATTKEGKVINLNLGPYGPYLSSEGKNYKLFGSIFDCTADKALAVVEMSAKAGKEPLKVFAEYKGKELKLVTGKYGAYIKWGDINCPIDKNQEPTGITQEEAEKIADANENKKPKKRK